MTQFSIISYHQYYYNLLKISIIYSIFLKINNNNNGGAISFNLNNLECNISFCLFNQCNVYGENIYGGAICSYISGKILINSICFLNCTAWRSPGYVFFDHSSYFTNIVNINLTNENNNLLTGCASAVYTKNSLLIHNNNITNSNTNVISSGIIIGNSLSSNIIKFLNIYNSNGLSILGHYNSQIKINHISEYINFLNNTISSAYFWFQGERYLTLNYCNFFKNSKIKMNSGTFTITFNNCQFDIIHDTIEFLNCITNNISFNIPFNPHYFEVLNTYLCYQFPNTKKIKSKLIFKIPILLFLFLIY